MGDMADMVNDDTPWDDTPTPEDDTLLDRIGAAIDRSLNAVGGDPPQVEALKEVVKWMDEYEEEYTKAGLTNVGGHINCIADELRAMTEEAPARRTPLSKEAREARRPLPPHILMGIDDDEIDKEVGYNQKEAPDED